MSKQSGNEWPGTHCLCDALPVATLDESDLFQPVIHLLEGPHAPALPVQGITHLPYQLNTLRREVAMALEEERCQVVSPTLPCVPTTT